MTHNSECNSDCCSQDASRGSRKQRYAAFCQSTYVPIYSKPWWMDAICGAAHWDVWLYEQNDQVVAAMPYYVEQRAAGTYITKPPLTQNNGIVFTYPPGAGALACAKFEEKVIDAAARFIESLGLVVYEQQYHYSFTNWSPFSWRGYSALPRYTYVIEDTSDLEGVWQGLSSSYRKNIKKGLRNAAIVHGMDPDMFYDEHAKVFERQGLSVPFSRELWSGLYQAVFEHGQGEILFSQTNTGIASVLFLVWDEKSMYHLLGGTMPGFNGLETYNALTWQGIKLAHERGLAYDFEGSMIKRIAKSFREFGGTPKLYFRIRKVFNPEVIRSEAQAAIKGLESDGIS